MKTPSPEIRQALYRHLTCVLPVGRVTLEDVAWPNASFSPKVNQPYLVPYCLFSKTEQAGLSKSGFERLSGCFQIDVYGVLNAGEAELDALSCSLVDYFRAGTRLSVKGFGKLQITNAYRGSLVIGQRNGLQEQKDARPHVVVSVFWQHYVSRGE